ncbi:PEGA domain-containing protein [Candidatus Saccharibacteria bacterium]|nr:PEGA domain-containing protein [Candidatus Saccharibacteria bacterium]
MGHTTMHRNNDKRKKRIQLAFVYTVMALSVVAIVTILVLIMQGYRFNKYDGRVEQGGLLQFDSRPSGATVTVDNITLANKTASKITVLAGTHKVIMTKEGYTSWNKTINVAPGSITWLNYTLLMPQKPALRTVETLPSVTSSLVSPDRKYLASVPAAENPVVHVVALNSASPEITKVTIPTSLYSPAQEGENHSFKLINWDNDGRYMIVQHSYATNKQEYLSIDLRGSDAGRNLTMDLGVDILAVEYSLASSNTVYIMTSSRDIRRADIAAKTLSGPLISNVQAFAQTDDSTIAYTSLPDDMGGRSVGYMTSGAAKAKVVRSYNGDTPQIPQLRTGKYYGEEFMVMTHNNTVEILKGSIPSSDVTTVLDLVQVAKFDCSAAVTSTGFSPVQNRFVVSWCGDAVMTYDLELFALSRANIKGETGTTTNWISPFQWATTANNTLAYYDFDGTNKQVVATEPIRQAATLSENGKYFYHFAASGNSTLLIRTSMTID